MTLLTFSLRPVLTPEPTLPPSLFFFSSLEDVYLIHIVFILIFDRLENETFNRDAKFSKQLQPV